MLNRPIKFAPYLKTVIWGGDMIAKFKDIETDLDHIGESWEISVVHGHESVVVDNPLLNGKTLNGLVEQYGARLLGTEVAAHCTEGFPLLIKLIDARRDLSIQVHPDDALAQQRHESQGKTEMWYIIDAKQGAKIYTGLSQSLTPEEYKRHIADNTIMDVIAAHDSAPGQFYFVPAGTIHAIGAGNLLAEVQQSSDITYRVYDYDRRDEHGNRRDLHTELAKDAIDYRYPNDVTPTGMRYDETTPGVIRCKYFTVDYLQLSASQTHQIDTGNRTFAILLVTDGNICIVTSDGAEMPYHAGETVLLPAEMEACILKGIGKGLIITQ